MWLDLLKQAVCEIFTSQEVCTRGQPLPVRLSVTSRTQGSILQTSINLFPQFSGLMNQASVAAGGFRLLGLPQQTGWLKQENLLLSSGGWGVQCQGAVKVGFTLRPLLLACEQRHLALCSPDCFCACMESLFLNDLQAVSTHQKENSPL